MEKDNKTYLLSISHMHTGGFGFVQLAMCDIFLNKKNFYTVVPPAENLDLTGKALI